MQKKILIAYSAAATHVQTTHDYLMALRRHSAYQVEYAHVTHNAIMAFDLSAYDVVFHSYCARFCFDNYVSADYLAKLKAFKGLKILAIQDEYDFTENARRGIIEYGFDVVLTCVPQDSLDVVYPRKRFPKTEFVTVLTGYLPADAAHRQIAVPPLRERAITVGYRGRDTGGRYGQLGFDKFEIGRRMKEICIARGIAHDIDWTEESRIYGEAWFTFLGSLRTTLGAESGSNVFDFDGAIAAKHEEMTKALGRQPSHAEFEQFTRRLEANVSMGQISPRAFEAALTRTPMVLYSGRYSGILRPRDHYIELKKDFSNVDDVLRQTENLDHLEGMARRAYDHLVASGKFSYAAFVDQLSALIERKTRDLKTEPARAAAIDWARRVSADPLDMEEYPTVEPKPRLLFRARQLRTDLEAYRREIKRLQTVYPAEIARLNKEYPERIENTRVVLQAEIDRLNAVYPAEIARLSTSYQRSLSEVTASYQAEIDRLNDVYPREICKLNELYTAETARREHAYADEIERLNNTYRAEIDRLHRVYPAEIQRIEGVYVTEIKRLNEAYPAEIARLNNVFPDRRDDTLLQSEQARYSKGYPDELVRREAAHAAEIARLKHTFTAEFERLHSMYGEELTRIRDQQAFDAAALRRALLSRIDRLNSIIAEQRPLHRLAKKLVNALHGDLSKHSLHQRAVARARRMLQLRDWVKRIPGARALYQALRNPSGRKAL